MSEERSTFFAICGCMIAAVAGFLGLAAIFAGLVAHITGVQP